MESALGIGKDALVMRDLLGIAEKPLAVEEKPLAVEEKPLAVEEKPSEGERGLAAESTCDASSPQSHAA